MDVVIFDCPGKDDVVLQEKSSRLSMSSSSYRECPIGFEPSVGFLPELVSPE